MDKFHKHEVLDRTSIIANNFDYFVVDQPAIKHKKKLVKRCDKVQKHLWKLYQELAEEYF